MEKKERESQKGQDLWSHLASNSFTFCSLQLNIREAGRAEWPGAGAKGQDVTSDSEPTSQTSVTLQGAPSPLWEQRRGAWHWPGSHRVPGWTPALVWAFKGYVTGPHPAELLKKKKAHTLKCSTVCAGLWLGMKSVISSSKHRGTSEWGRRSQSL